MPKRSLIYGTLIGLFAVTLIFAVMEMRYGGRTTATQYGPETGTEADTDSSAGVPIGGPFVLTAPDGARVSADDFAGRFMLIYFGYTFCPDVCPLDLQKITMALDQLEQQGTDLSPLQPLFITIDPARDTPEIMGQYVSYFHPLLIGLSGSAEDIAAAAAAYRVYYAKSEETNTDSEYLMGHSSYIYLMGPDGKYLDHFTSTDSPEVIAETVQRHLEGG